MSKLFYIMILSICSCSPFLFNTQGYEYLETDLETAWRKTSSFAYIPEDIQYAKSPFEFENDGGGDCVDFCTYMMYLLGNKAQLVLLEKHAIIFYNGEYLEAQVYGCKYSYSNLEIINTYQYNEVMEAFTNYGTKDL